MIVKWLSLPAVFLASAVLAGCGETERPLTYDKGVYGGSPDSPLSAETVDALRQRTALQR